MMIFHNKISSYHNPHAIIIFAFSLQNIKFCKTDRSRSMVRWLTDKISDIFFPVIVGDSLIRRSIFR